jgi:hypothetical protein
MARAPVSVGRHTGRIEQFGGFTERAHGLVVLERLGDEVQRLAVAGQGAYGLLTGSSATPPVLMPGCVAG